MATIEAALTSLVEGGAVAEAVVLRMTAHGGGMRGSKTLTVRQDGTVIASEFVPAKGIGKQDPPREIGSVAPDRVKALASVLLAAKVYAEEPPAAPGGAEFELGVAVGAEKISARKPSYAIKHDPAWVEAHRMYEQIRTDFSQQ